MSEKLKGSQLIGYDQHIVTAAVARIHEKRHPHHADRILPHELTQIMAMAWGEMVMDQNSAIFFRKMKITKEELDNTIAAV